MPLTLTYPGVYIEEIPSGVHAILGVATSITAFVGRAPRGEVNEPNTINSFGDYERLYGGLSLESTMSYAVSDFYAHGGSQAIIVRVANGGQPASSVGSWGNFLQVLVDLPKTKDGAADHKAFNLTVMLKDSSDPTRKRNLLVERFLNLSVDPGNPRYISRVLSQNSILVVVATNSSGQDEVPLFAPAETPVDQPVAGTGGIEDNDLGENDLLGDQSLKTGIYALEKVDLFNLLVIPPYPKAVLSGAPSPGDDVGDSVRTAASNYCEKRRAFYIIDSPSIWQSKKNALDGLDKYALERSKNSALFFPRLMEPNILHGGQLEEFVASGAVAGLFAKTDAQRG